MVASADGSGDPPVNRRDEPSISPATRAMQDELAVLHREVKEFETEDNSGARTTQPENALYGTENSIRISSGHFAVLRVMKLEAALHSGLFSEEAWMMADDEAALHDYDSSALMERVEAIIKKKAHRNVLSYDVARLHQFVKYLDFRHFLGMIYALRANAYIGASGVDK